jgi:hypothetical protein
MATAPATKRETKSAQSLVRTQTFLRVNKDYRSYKTGNSCLNYESRYLLDCIFGFKRRLIQSSSTISTSRHAPLPCVDSDIQCAREGQVLCQCNAKQDIEMNKPSCSYCLRLVCMIQNLPMESVLKPIFANVGQILKQEVHF